MIETVLIVLFVLTVASIPVSFYFYVIEGSKRDFRKYIRDLKKEREP